MTNLYDERDNRVWHVPFFVGVTGCDACGYRPRSKPIFMRPEPDETPEAFADRILEALPDDDS